MTAALHFEFPSRPLSRFVAVRASKDVRVSLKTMHYRQQKSDPPLSFSDLGALVEPHAGEFERSTVVKKENTFHDAGRLCIFQTKKFLVTGCGRLGKNGEK